MTKQQIQINQLMQLLVKVVKLNTVPPSSYCFVKITMTWAYMRTVSREKLYVRDTFKLWHLSQMTLSQHVTRGIIRWAFFVLLTKSSLKFTALNNSPPRFYFEALVRKPSRTRRLTCRIGTTLLYYGAGVSQFDSECDRNSAVSAKKEVQPWRRGSKKDSRSFCTKRISWRMFWPKSRRRAEWAGRTSLSVSDEKKKRKQRERVHHRRTCRVKNGVSVRKSAAKEYGLNHYASCRGNN